MKFVKHTHWPELRLQQCYSNHVIQIIYTIYKKKIEFERSIYSLDVNAKLNIISFDSPGFGISTQIKFNNHCLSGSNRSAYRMPNIYAILSDFTQRNKLRI